MVMQERPEGTITADGGTRRQRRKGCEPFTSALPSWPSDFNGIYSEYGHSKNFYHDIMGSYNRSDNYWRLDQVR